MKKIVHKRDIQENKLPIEKNKPLVEGTGFMIDNLMIALNEIEEECKKEQYGYYEVSRPENELVNIINNLKNQEKNIVSSVGDPVVIKQMSEEQIDGLLEMLKTPAFQSIAKQAMACPNTARGKSPNL